MTQAQLVAQVMGRFYRKSLALDISKNRIDENYRKGSSYSFAVPTPTNPTTSAYTAYGPVAYDNAGATMVNVSTAAKFIGVNVDATISSQFDFDLDEMWLDELANRVQAQANVTVMTALSGVTALSTAAKTSAAVIAALDSAAEKLMDEGAPLDSWFAVVPSYVLTMLRKDLAYNTRSRADAVSSFLGEYNGFQLATYGGAPVKVSGGSDNILFGSTNGIAYAAGTQEVKAVPAIDFVGTHVQALFGDGAHILVPEWAGRIIVTDGA